MEQEINESAPPEESDPQAKPDEEAGPEPVPGVEDDPEATPQAESQSQSQSQSQETSGIGQVIDVRRKLDSVPKTAAAAVEAVKNWVVRRSGKDSAMSIQDAVRRNLAGRNVSIPEEILSKGWYAEPRKAGGWVVGFKFISGGQPRTAEWIVDDVRREVKAANSHAEDLEWIEDGA
jgi:hypothetical protein